MSPGNFELVDGVGVELERFGEARLELILGSDEARASAPLVRVPTEFPWQPRPVEPLSGHGGLVRAPGAKVDINEFWGGRQIDVVDVPRS